MPISTNIILLIICLITINVANNNHPPSGVSTVVEIPHIDFIEMSVLQPHESNPDVIWYDDFRAEKAYLESSGMIDYEVKFGTSGGSMEAGFEKDMIEGKGNRKVAFGDFPSNRNVLRAGEHFDEIYWRIYVKHEYGWEGAPAKMSRATSIVSASPWRQAMIAHVWSGEGNSLTLDPVRGVDEQSAKVKTQHYNDFKNFHWLGNSPCSEFQISSTEESGYWIIVESMVRLNTPGKSDGLNRLWIDGRLEAERTNLNLRGTYTEHGINAVFLEAYWNGGAIKTENRWFDNFVISTQAIGPVVCPANPVIHKTPYHGRDTISAWEIELATDFSGKNIVFQSKEIRPQEAIIAASENGTFSGILQKQSKLTSGETYFCRVRQKNHNNIWSDWSRWHQPFTVE